MVLTVSDNGVGMNPETLEKLRTSLAQDEGSGFGMLASYKRLKLMYGDELDFQIESEENRGTEITVRIPYRMEAET